MSLDGKLDTLLADVTPALRDVLRTAYDLGYREALAAAAILRDPATERNGVDDNEREPESRLRDASPAAAAAAADDVGLADSISSANMGTETAVVDWSGSTSDEKSKEQPTDALAKRRPLLRILPHATVGTLLDRILYHFDLDRFDIDVVICRRGDRDRRQLKSSVRLSKYEIVK